jgi:hypothetical protein
VRNATWGVPADLAFALVGLSAGGWLTGLPWLGQEQRHSGLVGLRHGRTPFDWIGKLICIINKVANGRDHLRPVQLTCEKLDPMAPWVAQRCRVAEVSNPSATVRG